MVVEKGLLLINGKDMADYGCFLWEERGEANTNYDAMMKPPKMKQYTAVGFRERDGEELPEELPSPRYEARDIALKIAIVANTRAQWFKNYNDVLALLKTGWLSIEVPELGKIFKTYLKEYSAYSQFTMLCSTGQQVAGFGIIVREPKPNF